MSFETLMIIFLLLTVLMLLHIVVAFINMHKASERCEELVMERNKIFVHLSPKAAVDLVYDYYSSFSWRNWFGLRSLFIPYKPPYWS